MIEFSANLGFLWADLPLPDAIRAAKSAGFDAVECHWPYDVPAADTRTALKETGLKMLGLNTRRGDVAKGDNGCAAIPGREAEARGFIDEALAYAAAIGCGNIHVMAGKTDQEAAATTTFHENLAYACTAARAHNITILIEPLNTGDAPGYHLTTLDQAQEVLTDLAQDNLKIMFDCYHLESMQGNLLPLFKRAQADIGHVQIAGVPTRGVPNQGRVNYPELLAEFTRLGWHSPIGAEYKPSGPTDASLGWMQAYK